MTDEQERAIEALSLRDGGFAKAEEAQVVQTPQGHYMVDFKGNLHGPFRLAATTGFRRLMREVYGAGTTA